jgi:hypothetical protein
MSLGEDLKGHEVVAVREVQVNVRGARRGGGGEAELVDGAAIDVDAGGAGGGGGPEDAEEAVGGRPELLPVPRPSDERGGGRGAVRRRRGADPGYGVRMRAERRAAGEDAGEALEGKGRMVLGVECEGVAGLIEVVVVVAGEGAHAG